ncbi:hypothetical protein [Phorcysia thermohydrogeniphila]|uniref:Uncharacterized protein n=1 Tax=Phorcysia thermohydrogeniphila TaxID=936138 RepID=A0A4R1GH63_9BACT|nr:hypothetical protein [Phorcysia thermohydrogeniphila]TCK06353.1 hypothetical protein CLV27_0154 [Phorcysia thermohydrogeniphila]
MFRGQYDARVKSEIEKVKSLAGRIQRTFYVEDATSLKEALTAQAVNIDIHLTSDVFWNEEVGIIDIGGKNVRLFLNGKRLRVGKSKEGEIYGLTHSYVASLEIHGSGIVELPATSGGSRSFVHPCFIKRDTRSPFFSLLVACCVRIEASALYGLLEVYSPAAVSWYGVITSPYANLPRATFKTLFRGIMKDDSGRPINVLWSGSGYGAL